MRAQLNEGIPPDRVSSRSGGFGGKKGGVLYITSCEAIRLANEVFGPDGWSDEIVDRNLDFVDECDGRWSVLASAVVRVRALGVSHEDVGFGTSQNMRNRFAAIEKASKQAVSDARKRALRLFGERLGNCLYDPKYLDTLRRSRSSSSKKRSVDDDVVASSSYSKRKKKQTSSSDSEFDDEFGDVSLSQVVCTPP